MTIILLSITTLLVFSFFNTKEKYNFEVRHEKDKITIINPMSNKPVIIQTFPDGDLSISADVIIIDQLTAGTLNLDEL